MRVVEGSARSLSVQAKSWLSHQAEDTCPGPAPVPLFQGRPRTQNRQFQGTPRSWARQETSGWAVSTGLCKARNWRVASGAAREGAPRRVTVSWPPFSSSRFAAASRAPPPLPEGPWQPRPPPQPPQPPRSHALPARAESKQAQENTTHVKTIDAGLSTDPKRGPRPRPAWLGASAQ